MEHIRELILPEGPETIAAVLVEPVVGTSGILIPPAKYLPRLRKICDEFGILLILDEVMSEWGRTGKWFACDRRGAMDPKPDKRGPVAEL